MTVVRPRLGRRRDPALGRERLSDKGAGVQDVAPGRTIGGRYTLNERRLASADGIEAWSARDSARAAEVTLTLFPATAATSPAILDACLLYTSRCV